MYKFLCVEATPNKTKETKEEDRKSKEACVKYDAHGKLVDEEKMLLEAGLEAGIYVKKGNKTAIIEEVGNGGLLIRPPVAKETQRVTYIEFRNEWEIMFDKAELKDKGVILNFMEHSARRSQSMTVQREWARILLAMEQGQHWVDQRHPTPKLRIETKPQKRVFVMDKAAKKTIHFLPHTTSFACDLPSNNKDKKHKKRFRSGRYGSIHKRRWQVNQCI